MPDSVKTTETNSKPKRYTIADIRATNIAADGHFFDSDTLKFHGDKVNNWGVWHYDATPRTPSRVFIHSKGERCNGIPTDGAPKGGQVREFYPDTGRISPPMIPVSGRVSCRLDGAIGIFELKHFTAWAHDGGEGITTWRYGRGISESFMRDALMFMAHRDGYEVNHVEDVHRSPF